MFIVEPLGVFGNVSKHDSYFTICNSFFAALAVLFGWFPSILKGC